MLDSLLSAMETANAEKMIPMDSKAAAVAAGGLPVDELEQPAPQLVTRRRELWSYYIYYGESKRRLK